MRILMLVISNVATDTRVMREAAALADAGHAVHVIGKDVSTGYEPPRGRHGGERRRRVGVPQGRRRIARRPPQAAAAPAHRALAAAAAAPELGVRLLACQGRAAGRRAGVRRRARARFQHPATRRGAGAGQARSRSSTTRTSCGRAGRASAVRRPLQKRREAKQEQAWGARAATVITVGEGVADALRAAYGWRHVEVVRNTFPLPEGGPVEPPKAVSRGRVRGPHRAVPRAGGHRRGVGAGEAAADRHRRSRPTTRIWAPTTPRRPRSSARARSTRWTRCCGSSASRWSRTPTSG